MLATLQFVNVSDVQLKSKVQNLKSSYVKAITWRNHTGQGVDDGNVEGVGFVFAIFCLFLHHVALFTVYIRKVCPYYDLLERIFGDRTNIIPLFITDNLNDVDKEKSNNNNSNHPKSSELIDDIDDVDRVNHHEANENSKNVDEPQKVTDGMSKAIHDQTLEPNTIIYDSAEDLDNDVIVEDVVALEDVTDSCSSIIDIDEWMSFRRQSTTPSINVQHSSPSVSHQGRAESVDRHIDYQHSSQSVSHQGRAESVDRQIDVQHSSQSVSHDGRAESVDRQIDVQHSSQSVSHQGRSYSVDRRSKENAAPSGVSASTTATSKNVTESTVTVSSVSRFRQALLALPESTNGFQSSKNNRPANAAEVIAEALKLRAEAMREKLEQESVWKNRELILGREKFEFEKTLRLKELELRKAEIEMNERIRLAEINAGIH